MQRGGDAFAGADVPRRTAAASSARTVVVPMAIDAAAGRLGVRDGRGGRLRDDDRARRRGAGGRAPDRRSTRCRRQASAWRSRCRARGTCRASSSRVRSRRTGASKATGRPAIAVQTSQSFSGSGTCAYWIGRPCRAIPVQISSRVPMNRIATRRGWPRMSSTIAVKGPSTSVSPRSSRGGRGRSSVGMRWSPAPKAIARKCVGSPSVFHAASRSSIGAPLSACAAAEARRQRRRIVGDDEIAWPEQRRQVPPRGVADGAVRGEGEKLRRASFRSRTLGSCGLRRERGALRQQPRRSHRSTLRRTPPGASASPGRHRERRARGAACPCRPDRRRESARLPRASPPPRSRSCGGAPPCSRRRRPSPDRR